MTEAEIFEFDLNGYIMYRNVLTRDQVDHMNGVLDRHLTDESYNFRFLELDPMFMEVMALPRTLNILNTMIGGWMRLDHAYGASDGYAFRETGRYQAEPPRRAAGRQRRAPLPVVQWKDV